MSRLKEKLKEQKGFGLFEYVIGLLIFVALICFLFDVVTITYKQYVVSQQTNVIARQLGVQGGITNQVPKGFPGGDKAYVDSRELVQQVNDHLEGAGIKSNEWDLNLIRYDKNGRVVETKKLTTATNFKVDYQSAMDIELTYKYKWNVWGQIIPGTSDEKEAIQKRYVTSEFKYNYDVWEGERNETN
ncbi:MULTISPECIES: hypothetical protein [Bacillus]|uniref:Uncharacterized protein n=3 Tax=Bacillus cereus group TaxID=86661 RepID=A0A9X0MKQ0_BACCE|nr:MULTISPECIES: hypothetical protein [Bacillus]PEZ75032.1 hypothetical protein CN410_12965 [Bacillus anthracis]AFV22062.1 hypothetical protein BTB_502p07570 [Bacillus thuringiensis Bt407]EEM24921.1 hypothetical protein bthur0002_55630 [Bacillus thuringiensis Bt407]ERI00761.1 hypothetical protein BTCBT_002316 [Bacillus thuringiensis T01-328]KXY51475.1 hypothetical protein AT268_33950 [Bacillus cereus]